LKKIIAFVVIIISIFIFKKEILTYYANSFIVDNSTKNADMILILSGNMITRVKEAINLKKEGYSKKIFITTVKNYSTKYPHILKSRSELLKEIMNFENVNINYIPSYKNGATSTIDEAKDMAIYLSKNSMKRIILVTDDYHTRRALYIFKKIFKKNNIKTKVQIRAIYNTTYTSSNWYLFESGIITYLLIEPIKTLLYYLIDDNLEIIKNN